MERGRAAGCSARGGERIQAPRPTRVAIAAGAAAAYGGVAADVFVRASTPVAEGLAPGMAVGAALLGLALVFGTPTVGAALWLAGGTYVAFVAAFHHGIDETVPLVAVLLLLCGELTAWSLDERWRLRSEARLRWRRPAAIALLALSGGAAATVVLALSTAPPSHGLSVTLAGAVAAVAAAGTGLLLGRR